MKRNIYLSRWNSCTPVDDSEEIFRVVKKIIISSDEKKYILVTGWIHTTKNLYKKKRKIIESKVDETTLDNEMV